MNKLATTLGTLTLLTQSANLYAESQEPIQSHFSSPIEGLFNIPSFSGTNIQAEGSKQFALRAEIISNAVAMSNSKESVRFDGETWRLTPRWRYGFKENWQFSLELPLIRHTSGFLDSSIDTFHETFQLREGSRDDFDRNELLYGYSNQGSLDYRLTDNTNGIGDLKLKISHQLPTNMPLTAHIHLKAPTGDEDDLMSSGSWDTGLSLSYLKPALFNVESLTTALEAGQHYLSSSDQVRHQNNWMTTLNAGLFWGISESVTLKSQLEAHTAIADSDLEPLGSEALQLTAGVTWQSSPDTAWDFALIEDIRTDSTSDASFLVEWSQSY
ncbi:DUF3187 family protein [Litoribacillus peritrichatus]|uniref:DUF3187 family protein n=1 Tax=Litoribacillus peritrichatus TaxID=718191 RepID=A0ABP7MXN3_9GAMM